MRLVRTRMPHAAEAGEAPRPIALARVLVRDEVLEHDRRPPLPLARIVTIIRNARVGAAAGARQHEQPRVPLDEIDQRIERSVRRRYGYPGDVHPSNRNATCPKHIPRIAEPYV